MYAGPASGRSSGGRMKSSAPSASSSAVRRGGFFVRALSWSACAAARRERSAVVEATTDRVITNASRATPATASTSTRGRGMSRFSLLPIFQPDGNQLRDTGLLHRHSVEDVGPCNRPLVVGDDDELGVRGELLQKIREPPHIFLVEGRVDLVQQAEGRRLHHVDGEQERYARERALAAREQIDVLQLLSGRLGEDFDARLQGRLGVLQAKLGSAAAEQPAKHGMEVLLDFVVRVEKELGRFRADFRGDPLQIFPRAGEIPELAGEEFEPIL